jgi:hypothetical protein
MPHVIVKGPGIDENVINVKHNFSMVLPPSANLIARINAGKEFLNPYGTHLNWNTVESNKKTVYFLVSSCSWICKNADLRSSENR